MTISLHQRSREVDITGACVSHSKNVSSTVKLRQTDILTPPNRSASDLLSVPPPHLLMSCDLWVDSGET